MNTLEFLSTLVWPAIAAVALIAFSKEIRQALGRAKFKIRLFDTEIEVTRDEVEGLLKENWEFFRPTLAQWDYLKRLCDSPSGTLARDPNKPDDLRMLRPLRNAGLIAGADTGFLQNSGEVRITPLGRFMVHARQKPK